MRASDSEREEMAERLRQAAGEGRLTVEELDERLHATYAATTRAELTVLSDDLPDPEAGTGRVPVRGGEGGTARVISIMSGSERKGRWKLASRVQVIDIMGGSNLDLNEAEFASPVVEMHVFSLMGGSDIRVSDSLNVEISEFSIMGGNSIKIGEATPDPGGPTLRLKLISIMGGTNVRRGRRLSRTERKMRKLADKHGANHGLHPPSPRPPRRLGD